MSILYKISVGFICSLFLLLGTLQAKNRIYASSPDERMFLKCLINIPMGISPDELNNYLKKCNNVRTYDIDGNLLGLSLEWPWDISQLVFDINGRELFMDDNDSLHRVSFSFYNGQLYSIFGSVVDNRTRTLSYRDQFISMYGKPSIKTYSSFYYKAKETLTAHKWINGNKSITLEIAKVGDDFLTIKDDSIEKMAKDMLATTVQAVVYTYGKRNKLSANKWIRENPEYDISTVINCDDMGSISLKGKGSNLTCKILCEDSSIAFQKNQINLTKAKEYILLKALPESCKPILLYNQDGIDNYKTHFTIIIEKEGIELFRGIIEKNDCK
jgi:hypothetical protein